MKKKRAHKCFVKDVLKINEIYMYNHKFTINAFQCICSSTSESFGRGNNL